MGTFVSPKGQRPLRLFPAYSSYSNALFHALPSNYRFCEYTERLQKTFLIKNPKNIAKQVRDPNKWVTCVGCTKVFGKNGYARSARRHWKESTSCGSMAAIIYLDREHEHYNLVVGGSGYFIGAKN